MRNIVLILLITLLFSCSNKKVQSNSMDATNNNDLTKNDSTIIQTTMEENNVEHENQINIPAQETAPKSGHTGPINYVVFSPDGKHIVSCSYNDKNIRIWDVTTGQEIMTILVNVYEISSVEFSPDGKYIVSSAVSHYGTINIWDRNTGKEIRNVFEGPSDAVISMDISPDGKQIAAVYEEFTSPGRKSITKVKFYDINTGKQIQTFLDNIERITSIAFSPDGSRIITGFSDDGVIKIWDAVTGQELRTISGKGTIFESISSDGKYITSWSGSVNTLNIAIWDINTGMKTRTFSLTSSFGPFAINPDRSLIATTPYPKKTIRLIDGTTGEVIKTESDFSGHTKDITFLAFSPDGKMLVSGSDDQSIKLWDVSTGKEIRTMGK